MLAWLEIGSDAAFSTRTSAKNENGELPQFLSVFGPRRDLEDEGVKEFLADLQATIAKRNWRDNWDGIPRFLSEQPFNIALAHYEIAPPNQNSALVNPNWQSVAAMVKRIYLQFPSFKASLKQLLRDHRESVEAIVALQRVQNLRGDEWAHIVKNEEHSFYNTHRVNLHLMWFILPAILVSVYGVPIHLSDAEGKMEAVWTRLQGMHMRDFGILGWCDFANAVSARTNRPLEATVNSAVKL